MNDFFVNGISKTEFLKTAWRKKPLVVRGGARYLFSGAFTVGAFNRLVRKIEDSNPDSVRRDDNKSVFVQNLDQASAELKSLSQRVANQLSWPHIWFDGVAAADGASIGCHYDDSDNFVLQQSGKKTWWLASPEIIPKTELRRRMLKQSNVGNIYMPEESLKFVLEPGDLLYIPIFWPHWGVSQGHSLSLSLVCNASNAFEELLPLIAARLSEHALWWEPLDLETEATPSAESSPLFKSLFRVLEDPKFQIQIEQEFFSARHAKLNKNLDNPRDTIRSKAATEKRELQLDLQRIRSMFDVSMIQPSLSELVIPKSLNNSNDDLNKLVSLCFLKRFLLICRRLYDIAEGPGYCRSLKVVFDAFQRLPDHIILQSLRRPEFTSWVLHSHRSVGFAYVERINRLIAHITSFLFPILIAHDVLPQGEKILLHRSCPSEIHLLPLGLSLHFPRTLPTLIQVSRAEDILHFEGAHGEALGSVRLPLVFSSSPNEDLDSDPRIVEISRLSTSGPLLLRDSAWYREFYPQDSESRASPLFLDITDVDFVRFRDCLDEGAELVQQFWQDAWKELVANIFVIFPLRPLGLTPHNASVHGFRGLITTSARPSYLAAQTLLHEAGHNKFSSILDVFTLFNNEEDERYYSPFVKDTRPMKSLFHGVFAFLQDLHISLRLLGQVKEIEGVSLEKYVTKTRERIKETLGTIHVHAKLTDHGSQILSGFDEALSDSI
jgi:HEXXH motif-containing protein